MNKTLQRYCNFYPFNRKNNFDFKFMYNFNYYLVQKKNIIQDILYSLVMITNIREVILKLKQYQVSLYLIKRKF